MNFNVKFCVNMFAILVIIATVFFIFENYKNSITNISKNLMKSNENFYIIFDKSESKQDDNTTIYENNMQSENTDTSQLNDNKTKNILIWTKNNTVPFMFLYSGRKAVIEGKCEYKNCYITNDREYLSDITEFDAILFHIPEYAWKGTFYHFGKPEKRDQHQKYIIACIESEHNYPICDSKYDNFFNWTWTFKLDSDVSWRYVVIRDAETHEVVGPKKNMVWKEFTNEISDEKKNELKKKSKAVAWFVSNCYTKSGREKFVRKLTESVKKYGLTIDVYGRCGSLACENGAKECFDKLKNDYFFYLSFENSFSEDYVTEKFVRPMQYGSVPIVWGGANYSNFAPPGSYIDAMEINDPNKLAEMIHHYMNNINVYAEFFKWTSYYYYQRDIEDPETIAVCDLCKALNDPIKMSEHKTYSDLKGWWSGKYKHC